MAIREAREPELDEVSRVMVAAYEEYAPLMPPAAWRAYAQDIAAVRTRVSVSRLLVAEDDGRLAGAMTFYEPGQESPFPGSWTYMRLLAVAPDSRGRGVGRALVTDAIDRSRALGAEGLGIHTIPWMTAALVLYRSLGFQPQPRFDLELPGDFTAPDGSRMHVFAYGLRLAPQETWVPPAGGPGPRT